MKGSTVDKISCRKLGLHNLTPEIDLPEISDQDSRRSTDRRCSLQDIWNTLPMSVYRSSDM